jgi:hypothetical protein
MLGTAVAAGLGYFSFWWTLIPAFFAGSFALFNGPGYDTIMRANREGRTGVFPTMLAVSIAAHLLSASAAYGITRLISG